MERASRDFAWQARRAGVPITTNFYTGSHSWPYWQREMHSIWPSMMSAIHARGL